MLCQALVVLPWPSSRSLEALPNKNQVCCASQLGNNKNSSSQEGLEVLNAERPGTSLQEACASLVRVATVIAQSGAAAPENSGVNHGAD